MGSLFVVEAHQPPGLGTVVVGALTVLFFQNKKDPCSQGPLNLKFPACLSTDSENYPLPPNTLLWDATCGLARLVDIEPVKPTEFGFVVICWCVGVEP